MTRILPLLKLLAREDGVLENVLSTEPMEFKLNSFLSKIGRSPIGQLRLNGIAGRRGGFRLSVARFCILRVDGMWVGRYPEAQQRRSVYGSRRARRHALPFRQRPIFPREILEHPQLPRLWARARVDALLEKIQREGEDQASIDEIIRLARQYKFVTPYTSFLAVPRALLRPRVIRPAIR